MATETDKSNGDVVSDFIRENPELMTLAELQNFLISELKKVEGDSTPQRAFTPLTDGLGLESPRTKSVEPLAFQKFSQPITVSQPAAKPVRKTDVSEFLRSLDLPKPPNYTPGSEAEESIDEKPPALAPPPPVPPPTIFSRMQAAIIDQVFVLSLWLLSMVVSAQFVAADERSLLIHLMSNFSNPLFYRLSIIEYALLWFGYLGFSVALMNRTFGMWVWGLRIGYDDETRKKQQKWARIAFGFFFMAPLLPSFLLIFQVKGKNLLDKLSSTFIYRTY